jgi:hypothetical protein
MSSIDLEVNQEGTPTGKWGIEMFSTQQPATTLSISI